MADNDDWREAYEAGVDDAESDLTDTDNPFPQTDPRARAWALGFDSARLQRKTLV